MKKRISILLLSLLGNSIFAGGDAAPYPDLYVTKSCPQEYNGYWGFGAGWNYDSNQYKNNLFNVTDNYSSKYSAKSHSSKAVGHYFLAYNFYGEMNYSLAVEAGGYSAGESNHKTKMTTYSNKVSDVALTVSAKRQPAYYLALKPKFEAPIWWANLTLGVAATAFQLKSKVYYVDNVNKVSINTLDNTYEDGFVTYGWMAGVGAGIWLSPSWALSLDYDYINWANESSKIYKKYSSGTMTSYTVTGVKGGSYSHFVTLNFKNNFSWFFG